MVARRRVASVPNALNSQPQPSERRPKYTTQQLVMQGASLAGPSEEQIGNGIQSTPPEKTVLFCGSRGPDLSDYPLQACPRPNIFGHRLTYGVRSGNIPVHLTERNASNGRITALAPIAMRRSMKFSPAWSPTSVPLRPQARTEHVGQETES